MKHNGNYWCRSWRASQAHASRRRRNQTQKYGTSWAGVRALTPRGEPKSPAAFICRLPRALAPRDAKTSKKSDFISNSPIYIIYHLSIKVKRWCGVVGFGGNALGGLLPIGLDFN